MDLTPNTPGFAIGTDFLFDGGNLSAGRTLPVAGRLVAGLDANVYLWDVAALGDFEGRSAGVGPVVTFVKILGKRTLFFQAKWLPELDTEKRLNGDWVWVSGGFKF